MIELEVFHGQQISLVCCVTLDGCHEVWIFYFMEYHHTLIMDYIHKMVCDVFLMQTYQDFFHVWISVVLGMI